ncbi:EpsG family protein [Patiriisocius sp. Uisw_017]|uniref:EpsG family protein n=1 Tax=Patiriisocius sp. Uisw_017 TaxID=3230968 RepID=UPI0039E99B37
MSIYIFTLVVLLIFSFLELRTSLTSIQHNGMLFAVYALFVFQVGFRWQTGTDWETYLVHFEEIRTISDVYLTITGFEQGYSFFVLIVKNLMGSYTAFLVVHALLYYVLVFSAFKRLSPYIFISLLVFYATSMGVMGSNRQLIALGICLFALRYVVNKNALKFFLLVGLAFLFHSSAILFSVYYFLNKDIKQSLIIAILGVSFIIGKTSLPILAFSFVGDNIGGMGSAKVLAYTERYQEDPEQYRLGIMGLIKRFLFLGIFIYNYKYLTAKLSYYKIIFNGYFVGLIIYFLFSSSILVIVNRGGLYFATMEVLLIASQFLLIENKHYKVNLLLLLFIVTLFLFFQSIVGYPDLFLPYKGVFINPDFHRYRLD